MLDPSLPKNNGARALGDQGNPLITNLIEGGSNEVYDRFNSGVATEKTVPPDHVAALLGRNELVMPLVLKVESPNRQVGFEVHEYFHEGEPTQGPTVYGGVIGLTSDCASIEAQDFLASCSFSSGSRENREVDPFELDPTSISLAPFGGERCCVTFDLVVPELQEYLLQRSLVGDPEQYVTKWQNSSFEPNESRRLLETLNIELDESVDLVCLDGNSFGSLNKSTNPKKVTEWILKLLDHVPSEIAESFIGLRKAGDEFILVFRHDPANEQRVEAITRLFEQSIHNHFSESELERARTIASFKYRAAQFEKGVRARLIEGGQEITLENFLKMGMLLLENRFLDNFRDMLEHQAFGILKRSFDYSPSQQVYPEHLQSGEFLLHFFTSSEVRDRSSLPEGCFAKAAIHALRSSGNLQEFRSKLRLLGETGADFAEQDVSNSYLTRALFTLLPKDEAEATSLSLFGPGTFTLVKATVAAEELVKAGKVLVAELFEEVDRLKREGINNRGTLNICTTHLHTQEESFEVPWEWESPSSIVQDSLLASYLLKLENSFEGAKTGVKYLARSAQLSGPLWLYYPVVLDSDRISFSVPSLVFITRMIDISNFGAFNQRFGHDDADQILGHLHQKALKFCPTALCTITKGGRLALSWVVDSDPTDERHEIIDKQMALLHTYAKAYLMKLVEGDLELQVIGCVRAATDDYLREQAFPLGAQDSFLGNANTNPQHTIRLTPVHRWVPLSELICPDFVGT